MHFKNWPINMNIQDGQCTVLKNNNEFFELQISFNKRPKGPHIVHLSTMCHLFDGLARERKSKMSQPIRGQILLHCAI